MSKNAGTLVVVPPDGPHYSMEVKKLDIQEVNKLVGGYVERIKVRWEGRIRDCYLNEEGLLRQLPFNPYIRKLAEDHYKVQCQPFAGTGVIWVPNPRVKK